MPAEPLPSEHDDRFRELLAAEVAALVASLSEPRDECRSAILSIRNALAGLERVCDAAFTSVGEQPQPTAAAAALVERLAGALEHERKRARAELARVHAHNLRLEAELQATRDRLKTIESERAGIGGQRPQSDGGGTATSLKLISRTVEGEPIDPRLAEYAAHLFDHIQLIYKADIEALDDFSVIVERLAANLRHARVAFGRRLETCGGGDSSAFEAHLARLLEAEPQTAFGRHLAIAAYSCVAPARAEAS
jgi:hypothetical protein